MSKQYDVFLSFKYLGPTGKPTQDAALANEVFNYLSAKGLRVFVSKVGFEKRRATASPRAIDDALESAQVLIAIGTSLENLDSPWVRYEWESFFSDIRSELKPEGRMFSYVSEVDVNRLPSALRRNGVIVHKPGSLDRLYNLIVNGGEEDLVSAPQPGSASRGPETAAGPPQPASKSAPLPAGAGAPAGATPERGREAGKARASPTKQPAVTLIRRACRAAWMPVTTIYAARLPNRPHARFRPEIVLMSLTVLLFIFWLVSPGLGIFAKSSFPKAITNTFGMKMILLPAGEVSMRAPGSNDESSDHKNSQNQFKIDYLLYFFIYEVTQGQYRAVTGENPSYFTGSDHLPAEQVSWDDANAFCTKLNEREKDRLANNYYRLPTEAEWEYACLARSATVYSFGESEADLGEYAWFKDNSGGHPHPVGQREPNAWGLYDMHGNVWEWCWSSDRPDDKDSLSSADRRVDEQNKVDHAIRGGSWFDSARKAQAGRREKATSNSRQFYQQGLRLVRVPSDR